MSLGLRTSFYFLHHHVNMVKVLVILCLVPSYFTYYQRLGVYICVTFYWVICSENLIQICKKKNTSVTLFLYPFSNYWVCRWRYSFSRRAFHTHCMIRKRISRQQPNETWIRTWHRWVPISLWSETGTKLDTFIKVTQPVQYCVYFHTPFRTSRPDKDEVRSSKPLVRTCTFNTVPQCTQSTSILPSPWENQISYRWHCLQNNVLFSYYLLTGNL
jgi:hypothetical protein